MKNDEYLTIKEVSALLKLSQSTIYRYIEEEIIPVIAIKCKRRRVLRFCKEDVVEALKKHGNRMYTPQFLNMHGK